MVRHISQYIPENSSHSEIVQLQVQALSLQLQQIAEDIRKAKEDCRKLAALIAPTEEQPAGPDSSTVVVTARARLSHSEMLVALLRTRNRVGNIHELTSLLMIQYPEFIPMQIISPITYVQRKLDKAYTEGHIVIQAREDHKGHIYGLPEWLDASGAFSYEYVMQLSPR